nr:MAG TPA: hypothetical protein [Caudoviricetes sp.]
MSIGRKIFWLQIILANCHQIILADWDSNHI